MRQLKNTQFPSYLSVCTSLGKYQKLSHDNWNLYQGFSSSQILIQHKKIKSMKVTVIEGEIHNFLSERVPCMSNPDCHKVMVVLSWRRNVSPSVRVELTPSEQQHALWQMLHWLLLRWMCMWQFMSVFIFVCINYTLSTYHINFSDCSIEDFQSRRTL